VKFLARAEILLYSTASTLVLRPTHLYNRYQRSFSQWVKWLVCETDHLPVTIAKLKNVMSYTSTLPYIFMA
jgi:hypothetical protein